jgi:predicted Zn-dependent protease
VLWLCAVAVAITPAAAQRLHQLDPQDVANAQRDHAQMVQELGGAESGQRAAYVEAVGRRVGAYSSIADSNRALHFTLLNSAVENAFSLPGGYVYITRQLMTIMGDESQLAFALGHEIGHIDANHARVREQYARRNPLGVMGAIIASVFGDRYFGTILQARAKLDQLSFSREQEYQADTLGLRYMMAAGYDPAGAAQLLASLSRSSALEARVQGRTNRQMPEWALTHPLSQNRMERALSEARATGRLGTGVHNRDAFLDQLEGVYVDDDPAQGIIDGPTFTHPDLRIQFRVPTGYLMSNGTTAVTIAGSAGKAQFSGGVYRGSLDNYLLAVFGELTRGQGRLAIPPARHTVINGMEAAYTTARVNTRAGVVDASVVAYQWDPRRVYHFVMLTPGGTGFGAFAPMVNSLRSITREEAAQIRPRIIHVATVERGDTPQSLAGRMAYRDFKLERFLALNGLAANSRLAPGQKVKLVVYGPRRAGAS